MNSGNNGNNTDDRPTEQIRRYKQPRVFSGTTSQKPETTEQTSPEDCPTEQTRRRTIKNKFCRDNPQTTKPAAGRII